MLQIQGVLLWKRGEKSIAAEHFVKSAKLNPENGVTFRYLGDYYAHVSVDSQRAIKCYQRAVTLNPDDSDAGESMCDLLDQGGKESLEIVVCREASSKSPRAFWASRRLGFLQVFCHFLFSFPVQFLFSFLSYSAFLLKNGSSIIGNGLKLYRAFSMLSVVILPVLISGRLFFLPWNFLIFSYLIFDESELTSSYFGVFLGFGSCLPAIGYVYCCN